MIERILGLSIKKLALPLKREHEEMGGRGEGEIKFSKQHTDEDKKRNANQGITQSAKSVVKSQAQQKDLDCSDSLSNQI